MFTFDLDEYGSVSGLLGQADRRRELGPGRPVADARDSLRSLSIPQAFAPREVTDLRMAHLCLAGVWLLYDFLEESHRISQQVRTVSGSYWHGFMHRREPDFANAKYWFRHTGVHEVFEPLHQGARRLARQAELDDAASRLATQPQWDPLFFVDLCEMVARGESNSGPLCREVQCLEWELLFDYCYRKATAG